MADLLDEDGRCRTTELLPKECACAAHRGGEGEEELAAQPNYERYLIQRFRLARYQGRCKLVPAHVIEPSDQIGLAVYESQIDKEFGWVCTYCVEAIAWPNEEEG